MIKTATAVEITPSPRSELRFFAAGVEFGEIAASSGTS